MVEIKSVEFSLCLFLSIILSSSLTLFIGIVTYNGMNKLLFHENRLICTFIHSSINEILSLKDYSGIREVKVIFNLPYRFPPSQYVFRLISSNEYSLIMIGEGESTYSMIFPTCISVSETYFKTYGGLVILSVIFHDSHIEVRISSG